MLKKSLVYIIGKGISAVLAIVFIPLYTKYLAPPEYGLSSIILITIGFGSTIFTYGLNTGFMVMYYKFDKETNRKIFTLIHLLFLALLPISLIFSPFYNTGKLFFGTDFTLIRFWLTCLTILFFLYYNFYTAFLRLQQKPLLYVIFNLSYTLVVGLLTLWFILYLKLSYWSFLYSTFIGNILFTIAGSVYYRRFFKKFSFREQAVNIRRLFRICWPILPSQSANYLLNSGDKYILKLKRSSSEVGVYSISYKFGSLIESFLIGPFFESYNPVAYNTFANDIEGFKKMQVKYLDFIVIAFTSIVMLLSSLFEPIFKLFINVRYWAGYNLIWFIVFAYLFIAMNYLIGIVVTMSEKLYYTMYIIFFTAILNIVLNLCLIPSLGMIGAAIAFLTSYFINLILIILVNQKIMLIKYHWINISLVMILTASILFIQNTIHPETIFLTILLRFAMTVIGMLIIFLINRKTILDFIFKNVKLSGIIKRFSKFDFHE